MKNAYAPGRSIFLRPLDRSDAQAILPWVNDPETTRTLGRQLPMNLEAEEAFLSSLCKPDAKDFVLGICAVETGALVGITGLHLDPGRAHSASFGIILGKESWGKGYGSEATRLMVGVAFGRLNLNRVWLDVHSDNARGIKAYEKAGFRKEGVLRQAGFREGRYVDELVMAVLREEWASPA